MNRIRDLIDKRIKHAQASAVAVVSVIMMVFLSIKNITQRIYDCEYYWTIGDPVFENGIHILSFP